jgi:hypothetical protein
VPTEAGSAGAGLAGARPAGPGLAGAGLGGLGGLGGAGLAGAGLAATGLGGVRSAVLVNVGLGPPSGSADRAGRAALPVLADPDGLLGMIVGAEAGTAARAASPTGPSGRRNPEGLSERGRSADACGSAAPPGPPGPGL